LQRGPNAYVPPALRNATHDSKPSKSDIDTKVTEVEPPKMAWDLPNCPPVHAEKKTLPAALISSSNDKNAVSEDITKKLVVNKPKQEEFKESVDDVSNEYESFNMINIIYSFLIYFD